jgi:HSP20 family protein
MNLVKWNPLGELEDMQARLNRFFNDVPSIRPREDAFSFTDWVPAVDVQETDTEYLIKADLPEVKKDDVKVELLDGVLTLEGERRQEKEEKGKKFHKVERAYGSFVRRFVLPSEVDGTKVQAEFKDGVLTVRLPKTATAKPKAIEVRVA